MGRLTINGMDILPLKALLFFAPMWYNVNTWRGAFEPWYTLRSKSRGW